MIDEAADTLYCVRHPKVETRVRCSKCGSPICTRCMIQTPVGARCAACAQLRRLPQFSVGLSLLARALGGGLATSAIGWYIVSYVPYLRFFLGLGVGLAVGEVMSRLAMRRTNLTLEATAVVAVVGGLVLVSALERAAGIHASWTLGTGGASALSAYLIFPAVVASIVAVVKLR